MAQIFDTHHYCDSYECAASVSLNAGLDQEGGGTRAIEALGKAIDDGNVTMDTLNNAVRRLLKTKIELGMFDPPNMVEFNSYDFNDIENEAHLKLTRQVAQQSICLYKNTNNNLQKAPLPIQNSAINKIGLFGIQSV
ncbi:unnamed protein product, partial [Didymodactylos carnosus]